MRVLRMPNPGDPGGKHPGMGFILMLKRHCHLLLDATPPPKKKEKPVLEKPMAPFSMTMFVFSTCLPLLLQVRYSFHLFTEISGKDLHIQDPFHICNLLNGNMMILVLTAVLV